MPYEIREQYNGETEPEYCVYKLEPNELLKCYNNKEEAVAYLGALQAATADEQKASLGDDKYSTEEEAVERAAVIGCIGAHSMSEDGETIFMPCDSHEAYLDALGASVDETEAYEKALEVKAITDDSFTVAGYGVIYGGKDLEGDTFTKATDFMLDVVPEPVVLYDHAQEVKSVLGKVIKIDKRPTGLWMEAQISRSKKYAEEILELVKSGRLGYSTGSVSHLVERLQGQIKRWAIYEVSLTPTPAEPRTLGVEQLKALGIVINADGTATTIKPEDATLKGEQPKSKASTQNVEADTKAITNNNQGESIMSDVDKVVEKTTEAVQPEAPVVDMDALKAELNMAAQDAVKNAWETEAAERGGILTEAPAVKARTKMGGDHDGGDAFMDWARTGESNYYTKSNLKAALQEGTATEGGVLVPQGLHESIIAKRDDLSIARSAGAMVIKTSVDSVQVPSENASGGFALTAEEGAANQSEPTFTSNAIQVYKFTNLTKVSDELLADEKTNLEGFLGDMWARSAADVENEYFLKGTGSSQPKGVLVGGTAALTLDSATTIAASEIPELFYLLPGAYAQEGDSVAWATNQSTLAVIRGLTGDNFMFMPTPMGSGASGPGQELYGQPVYTSSQILAMATGRSVIVVGNWKYYGIVERNEIVISRNPYLYQGNGQVGFFVNIRFGGDVLQSEAFQYAQNA
jgi:HK97 family phage major capsid protein